MRIIDIVKNGFKAGVLGKVITAISTFTLIYLVNKEKDLDFYGEIVSIIAISTLISSLSNPGIKFSSLHEISVSKYSLKKTAWLFNGLFLSIVLSSVISTIGISYVSIFEIDLRLLNAGLLIAPLWVGIKYIEYISRLYGVFIYAINTSLVHLILLISYITFGYYRKDMGPVELILGAASLTLVIQILIIAYKERSDLRNLWGVSKNYQKQDKYLRHYKTIRRIMKKAKKYSLGDLISTSSSSVFISMAGFVGVPPASIAVYAIANKISAVIMQVNGIIKIYLMPEMARFAKNDDLKSIRKSGGVISRISTIIVIISCIFSVIFLNIFSGLINLSKDSIVMASAVVFILHLGWLVDACAGPVGLVARILRAEKVQNIIMITSIIISSVVFMYSMDLNEIAIAVSSALYLALWNIMLMIWLKRTENLLFIWR